MQIIKSPYNMVKKCSVFLVGLFAVIQISTAQVTVRISDDATDPGGTVEVDVTFDNFVDIIAFQHSINWDADKFSFDSIINVTTALDQFTMGAIGTPANGTSPGVLNVSWSKTNTQPETLPNNTRMFTIRLNAIGAACEFSSVRLSNTPAVIEFSDSNTNNVGANAENGTVSINGTGCNSGGDDLIISVDDVTANAGENRCVPIRVENFVDIQVVGFGLQWDPAIIEYTGFQNANLPDFSSGNIGDTNIDQGKLTIAWFDNTAVTPVTFEGILIEVCFDARNGGESPIDIVAPDGSEIDFTNSDEVAVPYVIDNGIFTVEGMGNPDDFTLIATDTDVPMGGSGCVPIAVRNFDNIQTMQFVIKWNAGQLRYTDIQSLNLAELSKDNITLQDDNRIRVSWSNPNSVTIPDGTVIFELCLEGSGDCDATSAINFTSDPFFDIEVSNSSNEVVDVNTVAGVATIVCDGCSIALQSLNPPSCVGDSDGSIEVTLPNNGFTCTWSDSGGNIVQQNQECNLVGVAAGTYTITIDDGAGCNETRTFTLSDPAAIVFGGSKVNELSDCDGSVALEMIGGTAPFTFLWDDGSTEAERTMLCAGEYCVTATDTNGCFAETCFTIQPNGPDVCEEGITDNFCFGDNEGAIDVTICGGTGPYTIMWSGPSGQFSTEDISGLLSGDYEYTISDASNPSLVSNGSISVGQPSAITVASTSVPSDGDLNNGSIDITVTGGVGPYSYLWSPGGQQTEDISGLAPGSYTVTVMDENNCSVVSMAIAVQSTTINFVRTGEADVSCNGVCDGVIEGTTDGGSGVYTYKLNGDDVSFPVMGLCPGQYSFEISDDTGTSINQTVVIGEPDLLEVVLVEKMDCTNNNVDAFIQVEATGGTAEYDYVWNTTGSGPRLSNLSAGTYSVIVTDRRGCTAALEGINIDCGDGEGDCFTSRSIITPNDDGRNDGLLIMCAADFTNKLLVFDRWGNTVFSSNDYDNTWMGTNNAGEELPEGGYLWVLEITRGDGTRELKQGSVTILRDQF